MHKGGAITKFLGYRRGNGGVGIRNHLLVLPTVSCANRVAIRIGEAIPEAVAVPHPYGCTFDTEESKWIAKTFIGFGRNPNVGAVLLISLGCETTDAERIASEIGKFGKPVELLRIQEDGGSWKTAEKGVRIAQCLLADLSKLQREECEISDLIVATECGGSDAFSGISANPAVGTASNIVVKSGGTVLLSETTEIIGAERILAKRAVNASVRRDLMRIVKEAERNLTLSSPKAEGVYITPGNIEGGLTTIEEKSLGCIYKAGTSPVVEVVNYAEKPTKKGLVLMDTPGNDVESVTGMVAGGAQVVVFTTGRGTPTGCPIAPVIKICSNSGVYEKMNDDLDINAGTIIEGKESIKGVGQRIFTKILEVASGKRTKSEAWRYQEFAIAHTSVVEQMSYH